MRDRRCARGSWEPGRYGQRGYIDVQCDFGSVVAGPMSTFGCFDDVAVVHGACAAEAPRHRHWAGDVANRAAHLSPCLRVSWPVPYTTVMANVA